MAEDVKRCGNGLVFEDYSAAAIARCIAAAHANLANLRARALACAPAFRARHGADRFIEKVESLFSAKEMPT